MTNTKSPTLNLALRGGKYQPLFSYEVRPATATSHPYVPNSVANREAYDAVAALLEGAGFIHTSATCYVSVEHKAQARICVSGSGQGATIGVEIFNEANAAELLGINP